MNAKKEAKIRNYHSRHINIYAHIMMIKENLENFFISLMSVEMHAEKQCHKI